MLIIIPKPFTRPNSLAISRTYRIKTMTGHYRAYKLGNNHRDVRSARIVDSLFDNTLTRLIDILLKAHSDAPRRGGWGEHIKHLPE